MHHARTAALAAWLALSGCGVAPAPVSAASDRAAAAPAPAASGSRSPASGAGPAPEFLHGLDCDATARSCTAPGFAVTGSATACHPEGASFGAISDDAPVEAVSRFQGTDVVASLAPGQFLCIHYTAQPTTPDGEPWLYVTAIPPRQVPGCRTARCGSPDARSRWSRPRTATCDLQGNRYGAGCPAGWVRGTQVEAYSMGL